jgi:hypothetical protein
VYAPSHSWLIIETHCAFVIKISKYKMNNRVIFYNNIHLVLLYFLLVLIFVSFHLYACTIILVLFPMTNLTFPTAICNTQTSGTLAEWWFYTLCSFVAVFTSELHLHSSSFDLLCKRFCTILVKQLSSYKGFRGARYSNFH